MNFKSGFPHAKKITDILEVLSSAEPHVLAGSNQAPEERGSASNHTLYQ